MFFLIYIYFPTYLSRWGREGFKCCARKDQRRPRKPPVVGLQAAPAQAPLQARWALWTSWDVCINNCESHNLLLALWMFRSKCGCIMGQFLMHLPERTLAQCQSFCSVGKLLKSVIRKSVKRKGGSHIFAFSSLCTVVHLCFVSKARFKAASTFAGLDVQSSDFGLTCWSLFFTFYQREGTWWLMVFGYNKRRTTV